MSKQLIISLDLYFLMMSIRIIRSLQYIIIEKLAVFYFLRVFKTVFGLTNFLVLPYARSCRVLVFPPVIPIVE